MPLLLLSSVATSCTILMPWEKYNPSTPKEEEETEKLVGKKQVFLDSSFEKGFLAIPGGGTQIKTGFIPDDRYAQNVVLKYGSNTNQPVWTLRQNNDVYNLNDKYCETNVPDYEDGYYIFTDPSKKVMINPSSSSVYLELDSSIEYGENERESSDTWAHLLIASSLSHQVKVGNLQSLNLSINIQLMKNIDLSISKSYANEMILYLQLSNSNKSETAKADKPIWFGIPFFNSDSSAFDKEYAAVDTAQGPNSGGFIYKFAMDKLYETYDTSLVDYNKHTIQIELIKYFEIALKKAQDKGYWTSSTINDLVMGDMNFGFELPGRRKLGIQFSDLKLTADYGE